MGTGINRLGSILSALPRL